MPVNLLFRILSQSVLLYIFQFYHCTFFVRLHAVQAYMETKCLFVQNSENNEEKVTTIAFTTVSLVCPTFLFCSRKMHKPLYVEHDLLLCCTRARSHSQSIGVKPSVIFICVRAGHAT